MSGHTPGPWTIGTLTQNDGSVAVMAPDGRVARVDKPLHDARLIAAAPDLLAAVKEYIEWGAMTDRDLFDQRFRDAVAKAEGATTGAGSSE